VTKEPIKGVLFSRNNFFFNVLAWWLGRQSSNHHYYFYLICINISYQYIKKYDFYIKNSKHQN